MLLNGACTGGCADGTYNSGGLCTKCDKSCLTCDGPSNTDCFDCATNYYSIDGQCTSKCPTGMVVLATGVCGCDGGCKTCVNISTKCLSCSDPTMFYYNYKC